MGTVTAVYNYHMLEIPGMGLDDGDIVEIGTFSPSDKGQMAYWDSLDQAWKKSNTAGGEGIITDNGSVRLLPAVYVGSRGYPIRTDAIVQLDTNDGNDESVRQWPWFLQTAAQDVPKFLFQTGIPKAASETWTGAGSVYLDRNMQSTTYGMATTASSNSVSGTNQILPVTSAASVASGVTTWYGVEDQDARRLTEQQCIRARPTGHLLYNPLEIWTSRDGAGSAGSYAYAEYDGTFSVLSSSGLPSGMIIARIYDGATAQDTYFVARYNVDSNLMAPLGDDAKLVNSRSVAGSRDTMILRPSTQFVSYMIGYDVDIDGTDITYYVDILRVRCYFAMPQDFQRNESGVFEYVRQEIPAFGYEFDISGATWGTTHSDDTVQVLWQQQGDMNNPHALMVPRPVWKTVQESAQKTWVVADGAVKNAKEMNLRPTSVASLYAFSAAHKYNQRNDHVDDVDSETLDVDHIYVDPYDQPERYQKTPYIHDGVDVFKGVCFVGTSTTTTVTSCVFKLRQRTSTSRSDNVWEDIGSPVTVTTYHEETAGSSILRWYYHDYSATDIPRRHNLHKDLRLFVEFTFSDSTTASYLQPNPPTQDMPTFTVSTPPYPQLCIRCDLHTPIPYSCVPFRPKKTLAGADVDDGVLITAAYQDIVGPDEDQWTVGTAPSLTVSVASATAMQLAWATSSPMTHPIKIADNGEWHVDFGGHNKFIDVEMSAMLPANGDWETAWTGRTLARHWLTTGKSNNPTAINAVGWTRSRAAQTGRGLSGSGPSSSMLDTITYSSAILYQVPRLAEAYDLTVTVRWIGLARLRNGMVDVKVLESTSGHEIPALA